MSASDPTAQRVLEAAGQVFAEKGYRAATVQEICSRAEANIAAVNYHFGSKEKLYTEAVRRAYQSCMEQVPMPQWPPGTPPAERLCDFVHTMIQRAVVDRPPAWRGQLLMREMFQPTAACAEFVREFVRPTSEVLDGILRELLPAETPADKRQLVLFSIVGQILHYRFARPVIHLLISDKRLPSLDADRLAEHITSFSLAAIRSLAPPAAEEE